MAMLRTQRTASAEEMAYNAVASAFAATHPDSASERTQAIACLSEALNSGMSVERLVKRATLARISQGTFRTKLHPVIMARFWQHHTQGNVIRANGYTPPGKRPGLDNLDISP